MSDADDRDQEKGSVKRDQGHAKPAGKSWFKSLLSSSTPPPPPASLDDALPTPEASANVLSLLTFEWVTPLLRLGYARPLEAPDLWKLQDSRSSRRIAEAIEGSWTRRVDDAQVYNAKLSRGEISAGWWRVAWWALQPGAGRAERERRWREKEGRRKPSLVMAMNDSVFWWLWSGGLLKVISDTAQVTSPLVVKAIINYAGESYAAHKRGLKSEVGIAKGIGLVIALFLLQIIASLCNHHFFYRSTSTGVLLRGGLITAIYNRSLRLTSRARSALPNGKLVNHISTDVSRIDFCAGFFHMSWTSPIQLLICLALLLINLGPSALAGFAVFVVLTPVQTGVMGRLFKIRGRAMVWTDKRVKLLQELLGGMKVLKFFAWEEPFLERLVGYRKEETAAVRSLLLIRSANNAIAMSMPVIASVIAFITYSLTGHPLDAAILFSSFTLFNLLRLPLMFLPISFSSIADAMNATQRLEAVFRAELLEKTYTIDPELPNALEVRNASFTWDAPPPDADKAKSRVGKGKPRGRKGRERAAKRALKAAQGKEGDGDEDEVFKIRNVSLTVPRGSLVAIVGPVGCGKTSLVQGLIGEMRAEPSEGDKDTDTLTDGDNEKEQEQGKAKASVTFGGSVGYCAQTAWIQNGTIRDNVLFGRPFDAARYARAVRLACLLPDLAMLPHGDMTEVGEKGISLSGGQKQRLGVARVVYGDRDVMVFDDPMSALDVGVGRKVFWGVMKGVDADAAAAAAGAGAALEPEEMDRVDAESGDTAADSTSKPHARPPRTRILITHALHFLPHVDYIYVMSEGRITEGGTYTDLLGMGGEFARFVGEFGAAEDDQKDGKKDEEGALDDADADADAEKAEEKAKGAAQPMVEAPAQTMMQAEERNTGAIALSVYMAYIRAARGTLMVPLLVASSLLMQGTMVIGSYWLVWWQEMSFGNSEAFYMGMYAGLGVAQAFATFMVGASFAIMTYFSAQRLHKDAITHIIHAPMSFFDTTPLGRIMNRFSKDIDNVDNQLGEALRMFLTTISSIVGAIVLISIVLPWFLIGVFSVLIVYYWSAVFYRASARELKRLDSVLRSSVYSHFSESLSGLTTIRAYGESDRFMEDNERLVDVENRAYWLTVTNQRWLGVRLDFLGAILTLTVALLTVGLRYTISPAQTGVVLAYILSVQQAFGWLVRQSAEVENNMNSVERIVYYAQDVEQEAAYTLPSPPSPPLPPSWPPAGRLSIENITLSYRPGLPAVLKGLSMSIGAGEKVGIVGRTGAGKSSIMMALCRVVELSGGRILLDDVDLKEIGLREVRRGVAIIPQDPLLFSGTLRSNLDPFNQHDDATLWDALKRVYLVENAPSETPLKELKEIKEAQEIEEIEGIEALGQAQQPEKEKEQHQVVKRFTLDTVIEDEGGNLSLGQRSLVSLARALVKNSKVIILDEATASVDYETDHKIQETIAHEFRDRTVLCIAHRLKTIVSYDRICVLDAGRIAEFDAPEKLYQNTEGIFRGMCERSSITLEDIVKARRAVESGNGN